MTVSHVNEDRVVDISNYIVDTGLTRTHDEMLVAWEGKIRSLSSLTDMHFTLIVDSFDRLAWALYTGQHHLLESPHLSKMHAQYRRKKRGWR